MEFVQLLESRNIKTFEEVKSFVESEEYGLKVKDTEVYPTLYCICQTDKTNNTEGWVRECNGIILEKNTNKIVSYTFAKLEDREDINPNIDISTSKIQISIDGVLVRVYYYNGMWMVSTKKCIDARKSRWLSKKNFHEMFEEVFPTDAYGRLDKSSCYSFVLCHPENSMVVKYTTPKLYHISTRNMETMQEYESDLGFERAPTMEIVNNDLSVLDKMKEPTMVNYEGYILVDANYNRQKFVSEFFKRARELWGNNSCRFFRYLEVRKEGKDRVEEYLRHIPQDRESFMKYERRIMNLAQFVLETYINKHVSRTLTHVPVFLKKFIYDLHGDFMQTREVTDIVKIVSWIEKMDVKLVSHLYAKYEEEMIKGNLSNTENEQV